MLLPCLGQGHQIVTLARDSVCRVCVVFCVAVSLVASPDVPVPFVVWQRYCWFVVPRITSVFARRRASLLFPALFRETFLPCSVPCSAAYLKGPRERCGIVWDFGICRSKCGFDEECALYGQALKSGLLRFQCTCNSRSKRSRTCRCRSLRAHLLCAALRMGTVEDRQENRGGKPGNPKVVKWKCVKLRQYPAYASLKNSAGEPASYQLVRHCASSS